MRRPEHFLEAERLLEEANDRMHGVDKKAYLVARAQVHATLATVSDHVAEGVVVESNRRRSEERAQWRNDR